MRMATRIGTLDAALVATLLWVAAVTCRAGVGFDAASNVLLVTDFPAEFPCTLKRLASVDRQCGWGKVAYDAAADAYMVSCDLRSAPRRHGHVLPSRDEGQPEGGAGHARHPGRRAVLGRGRERRGQVVGGAPARQPPDPRDPQDPAITPALKFDCRTRGQYGLRLGANNSAGGQLHAFHAVIAAATPDKAHAFGLPPRGDLCLLGDGLVVERTTISWVAGMMLYGVAADMRRDYRIQDCVFENAYSGLSNGRNELTRCVFRNMDMAVNDYGSLDAILTDCVFENNDCNLALTFTSRGVVAVDCVFQPPKKGDVYRGYVNPATKTKQYPSLTSRRHVIVEVVDEQGKPLPGAQVTVRNEQGVYENVERGKAVTDATGRTPGQGDAKAILLTEAVRKATDTENQPAVTEFTYTVAVSAPGYAPAVRTGLRPTKSWEACGSRCGSRSRRRWRRVVPDPDRERYP